MKSKTTFKLILHTASVAIICLLSVGPTAAQEVLTLEQCQELARQNFPMIRQRELVKNTRELNVENASRMYYPQLSLNGQATYQSDVTSLPIRLPGVEIPELSKDQYRIYAELNQPLYDGGLTTSQKRNQELSGLIEEQRVETELYKIREKIIQIYFGILLMDQQLQQSDLTKKDVEAAHRKMSALVNNGSALKSNAELLQADLLKLEQRQTEILAQKQVYEKMLGQFINRKIQDSVRLARPDSPVLPEEITRPELKLFEAQELQLGAQNELIRAKNNPRFHLFIQGGYGRPALNMLSNSFEAYYIAGLRFNWNLSGYYTRSNEKKLIELGRQNIGVQKETFLFNTKLGMEQSGAEIEKYRKLLNSDAEIIKLRTSIKRAAEIQLENGVLNSTDYLREIHAEEQAREQLIIHEIQLLLAQYTRQIQTGKN